MLKFNLVVLLTLKLQILFPRDCVAKKEYPAFDNTGVGKDLIEHVAMKIILH